MAKTVFITGAASGIGLASAKLFISKGWNVVATSRSMKNSGLKASKRVLLLDCDVTNNASIAKARDTAIEKFGTIDVVVNNAGIGLLGPFEHESEDNIRKLFDINVFGLMEVTRAFIPHFRDNNNGTFVNIASFLGRVSIPFYSIYISSKWAVEGFSETVAYELEQFNIRVKQVEPGPVNTPFYEVKDFTKREKVDDYQNYYDRIFNDATKRAAGGISSEQVAQQVYKAATSRSWRTRYPVGPTARSVLAMRRLMPIMVFTRAIKMNVGEDDPK